MDRYDEFKKDVTNIIQLEVERSNKADLYVSLNSIVPLMFQKSYSYTEMDSYLSKMVFERYLRIGQETNGSIKLTLESYISDELQKNTNKALSSMEEEMEKAVEDEDYEKAAEIRDLIELGKEGKEDELIERLLA